MSYQPKTKPTAASPYVDVQTSSNPENWPQLQPPPPPPAQREGGEAQESEQAAHTLREEPATGLPAPDRTIARIPPQWENTVEGQDYLQTGVPPTPGQPNHLPVPQASQDAYQKQLKTYENRVAQGLPSREPQPPETKIVSYGAPLPPDDSLVTMDNMDKRGLPGSSKTLEAGQAEIYQAHRIGVQNDLKYMHLREPIHPQTTVGGTVPKESVNEGGLPARARKVTDYHSTLWGSNDPNEHQFGIHAYSPLDPTTKGPTNPTKPKEFQYSDAFANPSIHTIPPKNEGGEQAIKTNDNLAMNPGGNPMRQYPDAVGQQATGIGGTTVDQSETPAPFRAGDDLATQDQIEQHYYPKALALRQQNQQAEMPKQAFSIDNAQLKHGGTSGADQGKQRANNHQLEGQSQAQPQALQTATHDSITPAGGTQGQQHLQTQPMQPAPHNNSAPVGSSQGQQHTQSQPAQPASIGDSQGSEHAPATQGQQHTQPQPAQTALHQNQPASGPTPNSTSTQPSPAQQSLLKNLNSSSSKPKSGSKKEVVSDIHDNDKNSDTEEEDAIDRQKQDQWFDENQIIDHPSAYFGNEHHRQEANAEYHDQYKHYTYHPDEAKQLVTEVYIRPLHDGDVKAAWREHEFCPHHNQDDGEGHWGDSENQFDNKDYGQELQQVYEYQDEHEYSREHENGQGHEDEDGEQEYWEEHQNSDSPEYEESHYDEEGQEEQEEERDDEEEVEEGEEYQHHHASDEAFWHDSQDIHGPNGHTHMVY